MPGSVIEQIVAELRSSATSHFPQLGEFRNVRVVGHTPKPNHLIYELVVDLVGGSERLTAKIYRNGREGGEGARSKAKVEFENLRSIHEIAQKKKLTGTPRPVGDFTALGAVVAQKLNGVPLQSIIMKAALLPGFGDRGGLALAASRAGKWLRAFHRATAEMPSPFSHDGLLGELEALCTSCRKVGLGENDVRNIMNGARATLQRGKRHAPSSAVLNEFVPLNVLIGEEGVGFAEFAAMHPRQTSFIDVAMFLASVEALEKYPFCNRGMITVIQESFMEAYGVTGPEMAVLRVMKMKALLGMFAHGRVVKDNALRKRVMWATVMKRFIQQAAQRSLAAERAA